MPGELPRLIERHPKFSWNPRQLKGMLIKWALGQPEPSSASASSLQPEQATPSFTRAANFKQAASNFASDSSSEKNKLGRS